VRDGQITLILVRDIGQAFISRDVPAGVLRDFLAAETTKPLSRRSTAG
jgi:hypothetical protein